jgi:phosphate transport system protein
VNVCERVVELNEEPPLEPVADLALLAEETISVVHDAIDVLVARDVDRATALLGRDAGIDARYTRIFDAVLAGMAQNPSTIFRATRIQSIAKYLERMADHAMTIAETVIFQVKGTDIRHKDVQSDPPPPPKAR